MFTSNFFPQHRLNQQLYYDLTPYPPDDEEVEPSKKKATAEILSSIRQEMQNTQSIAPRVPSYEEAREGRKKCLRCKRYYTEKQYFDPLPPPPSPPRLTGETDEDEEEDFVPNSTSSLILTPATSTSCSSSSSSSSSSSNTSTSTSTLNGCYYHPGSFKTIGPLEGTMTGWTCCHKSDGSVSTAYLKDSRGCRYAPFHAEDLLYTNTILKFGYSPDAQKEYDQKMREQLALLEEEENKKKAKVPVSSRGAALAPGSDPNLFHEHIVSLSDTLEGLAIRYGVTAAEIKRINRFQTVPEMQVIGRIFIPKKTGVTPVLRTETNLEKFRNATRASDPEARYYLSESEGNLDVAIELWRKDMVWESQQSAPLTPA